MGGLKVRVENESESKECQELFFELGVRWRGSDSRIPIVSSLDYPFFVVSGCDGLYLTDSKGLTGFRELTIPQLKDMVEVEVDNVNHPKHYTDHPSGIECIEITRHHDFAIGNAIKYLWRAGLKDSSKEIEDLEKAVYYINDKIKQLKGGV